MSEKTTLGEVIKLVHGKQVLLDGELDFVLKITAFLRPLSK